MLHRGAVADDIRCRYLLDENTVYIDVKMMVCRASQN